MSDNKQCPLCGSSCFALIVDGQELGSCSNEGCVLWSNMRPVKEWNTRPIEDAQAAEIDRLMAALGRIINYTPTTIIDDGGNPKVPLHCVHSVQYIARAARESEVEG